MAYICSFLIVCIVLLIPYVVGSFIFAVPSVIVAFELTFVVISCCMFLERPSRLYK